MKKAEFFLGLLLLGAHFFSGCATERTNPVTKDEFRISEKEISEDDVPSNLDSGVLPKAKEGRSDQLKRPTLGQLKQNKTLVKESAQEVISVPSKESAKDSFDRVVLDLNQSIQGSDDSGNDKLKKFPNPVIELVEGTNNGKQSAQHKGVRHIEKSSSESDKSFQGKSENWGNKFFNQNPNADAVQNSESVNIYMPKTSPKSRLNESPNHLSRRVSVDKINQKPEVDQTLYLGGKEKKKEKKSPNVNFSKPKVALSSVREKAKSEQLIENSPPKPLLSSSNKKGEESPSINIAFSQKKEKGIVDPKKEKGVVLFSEESSSFPQPVIDSKSMELGRPSKHFPQILESKKPQQILLFDPLSTKIYSGGNKVIQKVAINDSKNLSTSKHEVLLLTSKQLSDEVENDFEKLQHFLSEKNISGKPKENRQTQNYQKLKGWVPDGNDLNNSQFLEESDPKQFRHAFDWIERKGRTQVD